MKTSKLSSFILRIAIGNILWFSIAYLLFNAFGSSEVNWYDSETVIPAIVITFERYFSTYGYTKKNIIFAIPILFTLFSIVGIVNYGFVIKTLLIATISTVVIVPLLFLGNKYFITKIKSNNT